MSNGTLYDAVGGQDGLDRLVEHFYEKARVDPLLEQQFRDLPPEHVPRVSMWLAEVFGGPDTYSRARGGHPALVRAHGGRGITEEQRARWVALMLATGAQALAPASRRTQGSATRSARTSSGARSSLATCRTRRRPTRIQAQCRAGAGTAWNSA